MGLAVGGKKDAYNSEINVTPLADVMLVLLIIVMLIAPLLQAGVLVRLPEASNTTERTDNDNDTVIHIDSSGRFFVDNFPTEERQLLSAIQTALDRKFGRLVLIKADCAVQPDYERVRPVAAGRYREHRSDCRATGRHRARRRVDQCRLTNTMKRSRS